MARPLRHVLLRRAVLPGFLALTGAAVLTGPALARPGGWNDPYGAGPGWRGSPMGDGPASTARSADPREGRVEVSRFVSAGPGAASLGKGQIAVGSTSADKDFMAFSRRATFEAAVIDALIRQGYDTRHADAPGHQSASLRISRSVLTPAEEKRSPVSGTAAMEVGSRGSAYGLAVNVDLTKPRAALVQTRMDVSISDPASGAVLWEGYATIATREGDDKWDDGRIAGKLAEALFDAFPQGQKVDAPHLVQPVSPAAPGDG
ncbi:DUF4136 domain-containing protein [Novosphingobium colocasiae]|uniref:DUF4136 domain-containing protein n=1 Tax=Novosphingobium colocasiae TaxID=1256513 RepID=A0A918PD16_9SPHN|nr:DUF4136 domain-containing protein [Novosphingobium colocasiae]GGY98044.1 hypothetical protein GCM10011614_11490 [Novosphingobium colocasiae]